MSLAIPKHMRLDIQPPADFADAVEMYARKSGRHAKLKFVPPPVNCWVVELSLRSDDPTMRGFQAGKLKEAPTEVVYLWRESNAKETARVGRAHMVGYKLDELGVSKMIEMLEQTNTLSGRGQYGSHAEAARDQAYKGERAREKLVDAGRQKARELAEDARRAINKIPFIGIGIDLKTAPESAPKDNA